MLDTIALTLNGGEFEVLDPARFSPSAQGLLSPPYYPLGSRGNFSCVQNPTKRDFAEGRYGPRLTLAKRVVRGGFSLTLRVEFSAPKLIFGNNFDELRTGDLGAVVDALHRALAGRSIRTTKSILRAARVSAIHYSKNMAFTDFTSCTMVMRELDRIDLSQRLDLSHTDYRNEGHAIRYHTNIFEVTFYDKLKDLQKARTSEKRSIERDYGCQRDLFVRPDAFPKQLEVLRMEVRLGRRSKIVDVMNRIGAKAEPALSALFDADVAKKVLLHFWTDIRRQMLLAGKGAERPEDLLAALAVALQGRGRPGTLLQQLGCAMLTRSVGMRGVCAIMTRHCSARTWQRYKRQLKALELAEGEGFCALRQVDAALAGFVPVRLADLRIAT